MQLDDAPLGVDVGEHSCGVVAGEMRLRGPIAFDVRSAIPAPVAQTTVRESIVETCATHVDDAPERRNRFRRLLFFIEPRPQELNQGHFFCRLCSSSSSCVSG